MRESFAPLRVAAFRRLLGSYLANQIGDSIGLIALAVLVFDKSGSAIATASLFVAAKFLPAFLAPLLIARVDLLPANRVLPAAYLVESGVFLALAGLSERYALAAVLVLALADGTLALSARGLSRAAVGACLEPTGQLRAGNALVNVAFGLATMLGTGLGGLVVAASGTGAAFLLDAASFAVAAGFVAGLPSVRADPVQESFRARLRAGLRYVRESPTARLLVGGQALAFVFFTLVIPIEVIYAKSTLGTGDAGFGILLASWNAGLLGGGLLNVRLSGLSPPLVVLASTTLVGLAYGGMALADTLWLACAISVAGGIGNGFQWVSVITMLQEATPADLHARVMGLLESVGALMPAIGYALGGTLVAIWSPRVAFAVAGLGILVIVAAGALLVSAQRRRGVRNHSPEPGLRHPDSEPGVRKMPASKAD